MEELVQDAKFQDHQQKLLKKILPLFHVEMEEKDQTVTHKMVTIMSNLKIHLFISSNYV